MGECSSHFEVNLPVERLLLLIAQNMEDLPQDVRESLEFEKLNWAHGSVINDPFYDAPHELSDAPPGTLLKVEKATDTSKYLIPSSCALSRFIYQSETLTGSKVPVSAYILWPYSPRSSQQPPGEGGGYPVVAWAHGTSGFDPNAAPSHHKNLWQHFLAPYQIALQGYVVVATDYAGLGVHKYPSGEDIVHEYIASPAQANDVVHSVTAARAAFPELSAGFVAIGHSQGGGAAWAVAQKAASTSIPGYLGAVAVSPYTNILDLDNEITKFLPAVLSPGLAAAFADFHPEDLVTDEGQKRIDTIHRLSMGTNSAFPYLSGADVLKPDWRENSHVKRYMTLTSNGGKAIKGPLLIAHGKGDPLLNLDVIENAVKSTAESFPSSQIEFVLLPDVTHVSALPASQRVWMEWIGDRFAGRAGEDQFRGGYDVGCARPAESRLANPNWYVETAAKPFQAPGP